MKNIIINPTYHCLKYVLKRLNCTTYINSIKYIDYIPYSDYFITYPFIDINNLKKGHILYWNEKAKYISCGNEMNKYGRVIHNKILTGIHYAIYEGNNLYTDCSYINGTYPYIAWRKIIKVPNYYLIKKHQ